MTGITATEARSNLYRLIDETGECVVSWRDEHGTLRRATVPDVLFSR